VAGRQAGGRTQPTQAGEQQVAGRQNPAGGGTQAGRHPGRRICTQTQERCRGGGGTQSRYTVQQAGRQVQNQESGRKSRTQTHNGRQKPRQQVMAAGDPVAEIQKSDTGRQAGGRRRCTHGRQAGRQVADPGAKPSRQAGSRQAAETQQQVSRNLREKETSSRNGRQAAENQSKTQAGIQKTRRKTAIT